MHWRSREARSDWVGETLTLTLLRFVCLSGGRRTRRENMTKPSRRKSVKKEVVNKTKLSQNTQGEENGNRTSTVNKEGRGQSSVTWSHSAEEGHHVEFSSENQGILILYKKLPVFDRSNAESRASLSTGRTGKLSQALPPKYEIKISTDGSPEYVF